MDDSRSAGTIQIVTFRDEYAAEFGRLNREWLEGFGLLEPADVPYLEDPRQHIIAKGGEVFFAVRDGTVLGTCAVVPSAAGVVELAKLAVAPVARGQGLGRRLVLAVLELARERGARRVVLSSSTKLGAAVRLYEALGFKHIPRGAGVDYATADVFMALDL